MNCQPECIHDIICDILIEKLRIPKDLLVAENMSKPLTGSPFHLSCIKLTYLFFEVEKALHIRIDSDCLQNYGFSTLGNIEEIVAAVYDDRHLSRSTR